MVQANRQLPLLPTFGIKLNGESMTKDMAPWIASIAVHDDINLPGMFDLVLAGRDPADRAVPWVDDKRLQLGANIQLSLGYDAQLETVISGEITDLEPIFSMGGPPQFAVRGQDRRHLLNTVPRTRSFEKLKNSEIAQQILQEIVATGMEIDVKDSRVTRGYQWQDDETDLAFVQRLAEDIGFELVMEGTKLLFRPQANDGVVAATLTFDDDLFDFRPHMTLLPWTTMTMLGTNLQGDKFKAFADAEKLVGKMGKTPGNQHIGTIVSKESTDMLVPVQVSTQAEVDQLVAALFNAKALDYIRGDGRCRGRTDVRAGRIIRIDKIGSRFSGPYYVTSVAHTYSPGDGYTTSFRVRRNAA